MTGLKELLIGVLNKGKSVHMKFIAVINKKGVVDFKLFKINLNVLLVDGSSVFSAKKELTSEDFLKFFLNSADSAYFNTYVPFNKLQILSRLNIEKDLMREESMLTEALMIETIFDLMDERRSKAIEGATILANKVLFILKLAEKYDLLYQVTYIIQFGSTSTATSWLQLEIPVVDKFFDDFYIEMVRMA